MTNTAPLPTQLSDENSLFITASKTSSSYHNHPIHTVCHNNPRLDFVEASDQKRTQDKLQRGLNDYIMSPNSYSPLDSLQRFLDQEIYSVSAAPNLIYLPQQRESLFTKLAIEDPEIFEKLRNDFIDGISGGAPYSGTEDMIGGGISSLSRIQQEYPQLYYALMEYIEQKRSENVTFVETVSQNGQGRALRYSSSQRDTIKGDLRKLFAEMVTPVDIGTMIRASDYTVSQSRTADKLMLNWSSYAQGYDGISFIDIAIGQTTHLWPAVKLSREFTKSNTVRLGTVQDLVKKGYLTWPETPKSGFTLSKEKRQKQRDFSQQVATLKSKTLG